MVKRRVSSTASNSNPSDAAAGTDTRQAWTAGYCVNCLLALAPSTASTFEEHVILWAIGFTNGGAPRYETTHKIDMGTCEKCDQPDRVLISYEIATTAWDVPSLLSRNRSDIFGTMRQLSTCETHPKWIAKRESLSSDVRDHEDLQAPSVSTQCYYRLVFLQAYADWMRVFSNKTHMALFLLATALAWMMIWVWEAGSAWAAGFAAISGMSLALFVWKLIGSPVRLAAGRLRDIKYAQEEIKELQAQLRKTNDVTLPKLEFMFKHQPPFEDVEAENEHTGRRCWRFSVRVKSHWHARLDNCMVKLKAVSPCNGSPMAKRLKLASDTNPLDRQNMNHTQCFSLGVEERKLINVLRIDTRRPGGTIQLLLVTEGHLPSPNLPRGNYILTLSASAQIGKLVEASFVIEAETDDVRFFPLEELETHAQAIES
jgi:hypothetical protein